MRTTEHEVEPVGTVPRSVRVRVIVVVTLSAPVHVTVADTSAVDEPAGAEYAR